MGDLSERGKQLRRDYEKEYKRSVEEKEEFFAEQARALLTFSKDFARVQEVNEDEGRVRWFQGGMLNACYNAVDRHAEKHPDKPAIIFESDSGESKVLTYKALLAEVVKYANYIKSKGLVQGDTVAVYMPMIPEALIACLACARLGVAHTVVFGGFSADSLALRIEDSRAKLLVTVDYAERGGKALNYLENVHSALEILDRTPGHSMKNVLIVNRKEEEALRKEEALKKIVKTIEIDLLTETAMDSTFLPCVEVDAENVLFHLYTSGSTGKPKGLSHSTAGYLLYAALTSLVCFDIKEDDVFFCTADLGWITGHTYVMYGPLALGITTVVFGSVPTHPDPLRLFRAVEKHRASHLYTAPTVIRLLQQTNPEYTVARKDGKDEKDGKKRGIWAMFSKNKSDVFRADKYMKVYPEDSPLRKMDLSSLRVLGSVGEPINRGAYIWFSMFFGDGRCPVVDTYWQTEAGGVMISPLPDVTKPKPESACFPFFGMSPVIMKKDVRDGEEVVEEKSGENGILLFKGYWPGIARTIVGNHRRYIGAYFKHRGYFYTGDEACRESDGYFWVRGRVDDVINVSGHRLSTAEIESAVCSTEGVAEAAALGEEDELTGQSICLFVVHRATETDTDELQQRIRATLRKRIGAVVSPKRIVICPELPKTSTGKMMRRVLRKLLEGQDIGDISTCMNPDSIAQAKAKLGTI